MPWPMSTGFGSPARMGNNTLAASTVRHLTHELFTFAFTFAFLIDFKLLLSLF